MDRLNNTKSSLITFNHRQMNGKGDTYRPTDKKKFDKNYDKIFQGVNGNSTAKDFNSRLLDLGSIPNTSTKKRPSISNPSTE